MIFAFIEGGTLEIHASVADIEREYEGIDVESRVVQFYDVTGRYLAPVFSVPNRVQRHFFLFSSVVSGKYDLQPVQDTNQKPFWMCLVETNSLEANPYFATLADVKAYFAHLFPQSFIEK